MNFEEDVFKRKSIDFEKLISYGFRKENDRYVYQVLFLENQFEARITVSKEGIVEGTVYDNDTKDIYTALRMEASKGVFVGKVRDAYLSILEDISTSCADKKLFCSNQANRIAQFVWKKYQNEPEFLWKDTPECGVFRNQKTKKWYGIIMSLDYGKLDKVRSGKIEIMNVKVDVTKRDSYLKQKGIYEAYHMNKKNWITLVLDDTLKDEDIFSLLEESYELVCSKNMGGKK